MTPFGAKGPNPSGLCWCGCGERTTLSRRSVSAQGLAKGQPVRFVPGHYGRRGYTVDLETGCWNWQGSLDRDGYARCRLHRVYYERAKGPIPVGLELDHLCRNRACVNPEHLEPVTRAENARRGSQTRLTTADVQAIRASNEPYQALAQRFGVDPSHISHIRAGRTWRDLDIDGREGLAAA